MQARTDHDTGFDRIIVTCPGPQAKLLIPIIALMPLQQLSGTRWALMCTFSIAVPYDISYQ